MEKPGDGTVRLEGVETVPSFRLYSEHCQNHWRTFTYLKVVLGLSKNLLHVGLCHVSQIKSPGSQPALLPTPPLPSVPVPG